MCSHEVLQCANNALFPKQILVQLEQVERVADISDPAFALSPIDLATPGVFHRDRYYGSLCITPLLHNYPTKRGQIGLLHTATWS